MSDDPTTPFDVESQMLDINRRMEKAPGVIKEHHNRVREAKSQYKMAWALAYRAAEGTQLDRKAEADLATAEELAELDQAEIEYKFVSDTFDSLKTKLRALQSISSLMKASMFSPQGGI